jgi:hypothetical protein
MGTFSDVAELRIKILGDGAQKDMKTLKLSAKEIKDELLLMENAGKKNTEEYKQMKTLLSDVNMAAKSALATFDLQNASLNEMRAKKAALNTELNKLVVGSKEWVAKMNEIAPIAGKINDTTEKIRGLGKEADGQGTGWQKYGMLVKAAFVVGVIVEFAKQLWATGMEVFNLTAKFEKYEVVLKNALGSQEKATAALKMLKDIAATTPFSLDEMTSSFNKMVNRGLLPTSAEMKNLSDLAASQGKDFDQLTEAVLDAQMGEQERLKEFGIKMKKNGDDVTLSFKGQSTTIKNTEENIYKAIVAMGDYNGVAGVTSEVSDKLAGKQSNLGDKIDFVVVKLGDKLKPVFHFVLDMFMKGVGIVGDFVDNIGPLGTLVDYVGDTFGALWNIGKELFLKVFPSAKGQVFDMATAVKVLGTVLYAVLVPFQILRAAVVGVIDAFRVMGDATGMVWKALKGDFEGAKADAKKLEVSWNSLKKNGTENFGAIGKGLQKIWSDNAVDIKKDAKGWDEWVKDLKKGQGEVTVDADKNAKARAKIKDEERKKDEERFNELYDGLQVMYKEHVEIMKQLDETAIKERVERNKDMGKAIEAIEKNIEKVASDRVASSENLEKRSSNLTMGLNELVDKQRKEYWDAEKKRIEEQKRTLENQMQMAMQATERLMQKTEEFLDKVVNTSEDANKRMAASLGKDFLKPMQNNLNGAKALISGDFVGAAEGLLGYFQGIWKTTIGLKQTLKDIKESEFWAMFDKGFEQVSQYAEQIKETFGSLVKDVEAYDAAMSDKSGVEQVIEAQLKLGEQIRDNYETAVEKEEEYSDTVKRNIEEAYNLEVQRINDKYDILNQKAGEQFTAEGLAIQERTNRDLLAFLTNEDSKNAILSDYNAQRSFIMAAYASQIKPLNAEMSQVEIDGITAATKARDEQLAKVEGQLSQQLQSVINSEGQRLAVVSETDKILEAGKEALNQLSIKYDAEELARNTAKNLELTAAEAKKNTDLETEAKRHNDELVRLGQDKDAALMNSFNALKEAMKTGYSEILAAANAAYQQGIITADQYAAAVQRVISLKQMLGDGGSLSERLTDRFRSLNIPGFALGTSYVDPDDYYPDGTDTVPAMLNKGERVLTAMQNKQLGNVSNEELVRRMRSPSPLAPNGGMLYSVDMGLVNRMNSSGVPTMGGLRLRSATDGGGYGSWVSGPQGVMGGFGGFGGFGSAQPPRASGQTASMPAVQDNGVAGALARNNELMQALVNLVANGTNEELKRIAEKPNLTLHDVNKAKAVESAARGVSDF